MADKGIIGTLTGHIADWITSNSGLSGSAKKALSTRTNRIDAAVDAATSGTSQQKTKKPTRNQ